MPLAVAVGELRIAARVPSRRRKLVSGVLDRAATAVKKAGVWFAPMQELPAEVAYEDGELNWNRVDGKQQRLHRVRAVYSAGFPATNPIDLKWADPILKGLRGDRDGSADSYDHLLRSAFTKLERQVALGNYVTNFNACGHVF